MLEHSISGEFSKRTGNHIAWYAPYGEFTTADGNLVLAVTRQEEFEALCRVLGKPELAKDPRFADNNARVQNREALIEEIQSCLLYTSTPTLYPAFFFVLGKAAKSAGNAVIPTFPAHCPHGLQHLRHKRRNVRFEGLRRVHTCLRQQDRTQRITGRNRGLPDGTAITTLDTYCRCV